MLRRLGLVWMLAACGGAQAPPQKSAKVSALEDELEETRASLTKEKAARAQAEQTLADTKAKCAAELATARMAPTPAAPAAPIAPVAPALPAPATQPVPPPVAKVLARVTEKSATGGAVRLVLSAGRARGIAAGWTGVLFEGKGTRVIGRFKITAVRETESEGLINGATIQAVGANDRVELSPPGTP